MTHSVDSLLIDRPLTVSPHEGTAIPHTDEADIPRDADLLQRQFTTDDPEAVENLSLLVPTGGPRPTIEYLYDLTPPQGDQRERIRCAHCKYPNHWKGYVMLSHDGIRFLVGKDCGAKLYDADFVILERSFNRQRARQGLLRRLGNLRTTFPPLLAEIASIIASGIFEQFRAMRSDIHRRLPKLSLQLRTSALRHDGALIIYEKIRDYAAEERRADKERESESTFANLTVTRKKHLRRAGLEPKKDDHPLFKTVDRPIGQFSGKALFTDLRTQTLKDYLRQLQVIFREVNDTSSDELTTSRLEAIFRQLHDALLQIEHLCADLRAIPQFFHSDHLSLVARWANHNAGGTEYSAQGQQLRHRTSRGEEAIAFPANYTLPSPAALQALRAALRSLPPSRVTATAGD